MDQNSRHDVYHYNKNPMGVDVLFLFAFITLRLKLGHTETHSKARHGLDQQHLFLGW